MTFTYANGTISSAARLTTASGTTIYLPGSYFTQTLDGAMLSNSTSPYTTSTSYSLWAGGSSSGALTGNFAATLTGMENAAWAYYYHPKDLGDVTGTISGVLMPSGEGTQVGALTIFPSYQDTPFMSSLPLSPTPYLFDRWGVNTPIVGTAFVTNNQLTSAIFATDYQDGRYGSSIYTMTQTPTTTPVTPISAVYNFTQSYNGSMGVTIGGPGTTSGTIYMNANGWGQRLSVGTSNTPGTENLDGYFNIYNNQGTWTLGSGSPPLTTSTSSTFGFGSAVLPPTGGAAQMTGSVSGTLGQSLSGNMTFIGSLFNGTSFSYSGPVSIDNGGSAVFNYTGSWAGFANGTSTPSYGTASGTMYQWPGYYFKQTMGTSGGTLTLTPPLTRIILMGPSLCPEPAGPAPGCSTGPAAAVSAAFSTLIRSTAASCPRRAARR